MSSEEEDYMSDAFLLQLERADTRPGLAPKNKQKQYEKEKKEKESNASHRGKTLPRKQLEIQQREAGLSTSISENSKGFALLQKMGYKPGMGIGKSGEGRVEPVGFQVKTSRSGLGKDSDMKRKSSEMNSMRAAMQAKRHKIHQRQTESFQSRMKDKFSDRLLEKDLRTAQKACMQLDQQAGLSEPPEPFFWPANSLPISQPDRTCDDSVESLRQDGGAYSKHPYEHPEEEDDEDVYEESKDDIEEEEVPYYLDFSVSERTDILTRYLRNVYRYCIWCGTSFEDEKEMASTCPGNSSELHD